MADRRNDSIAWRERISAIDQYMHDFLLASVNEGYSTVPVLAVEHVERARASLNEADKILARTRRFPVGGERVLHEAPAPNELCGDRARKAFCDV